MRLRRIAIRRLPGIPRPGFELDGFADGINVVVGPNASGKTSIPRAVRAALYGGELVRESVDVGAVFAPRGPGEGRRRKRGRRGAKGRPPPGRPNRRGPHLDPGRAAGRGAGAPRAPLRLLLHPPSRGPAGGRCRHRRRHRPAPRARDGRGIRPGRRPQTNAVSPFRPGSGRRRQGRSPRPKTDLRRRQGRYRELQRDEERLGPLERELLEAQEAEREADRLERALGILAKRRERVGLERRKEAFPPDMSGCPALRSPGAGAPFTASGGARRRCLARAEAERRTRRTRARRDRARRELARRGRGRGPAPPDRPAGAEIEGENRPRAGTRGGGGGGAVTGRSARLGGEPAARRRSMPWTRRSTRSDSVRPSSARSRRSSAAFPTCRKRRPTPNGSTRRDASSCIGCRRRTRRAPRPPAPPPCW